MWTVKPTGENPSTRNKYEEGGNTNNNSPFLI